MQSRKKVFLFIMSLIMGLSLLGGILYYIGFDPLKDAASALSVWKLSVVAILFLFVFFIIALRWQILLKGKYKVKISFANVFIANILDFAVSYITPTVYLGGEPVRAYFVSQKTGMNFTESLASAIIDKFIDIVGYISVLVLGLLALTLRFALPRNLEVVFLASIVFLVLLIYSVYHRIQNKQRLFSRLIEVLMLDKIKFFADIKDVIIEIEEDIIDFFHNHNKIFHKMIAMTILARLVLLIDFWLLIYLLGVKIGFLAVLAITAIVIFSYLVPIPGSLGAFEAALAFGFTLIGLGSGTGLLFALVVRGLYFLALIFGIFLLSHYFSKDILECLVGMGKPNRKCGTPAERGQ